MPALSPRHSRPPAFLAAVALLAFGPAALASPYTDINAATAAAEVTARPVRGGVTMLEGAGGNIGVLAAPDGLFLVDAGIAVSQAKIETALRALSPGRVRYVVDTHWHWDHTDGNGWARRGGATVIASRNTLARLKQTTRVEEWEHTFPPVPADELPNMVLSGGRAFEMAGDRALVRPYRPGHTNGDLSVYFAKADVLATGDTFWNGAYPFIDYVAGGGIDGAIRAADANLAMSGPDTLFIPGHGPVADRADAQAFRDMLVEIRKRVAALKSQGMTLDQVQAARPTADYDARWGQSVINGRLFTALVYRGV